jgi:uncharacterized repeat protein (TIGR03803 family)
MHSVLGWRTLALSVVCLVAITAPAQTFTTLDTGVSAYGPLVQGVDGNLYGADLTGGSQGHGSLFRITPEGTLSTLHTFITHAGGELPTGLVLALNGNLYGTTNQGGTQSSTCPTPVAGCGTVFGFTPTGSLFLLHRFSGADGMYPSAGLTLGSDGNLYGTTNGSTLKSASGPVYGNIFKINPGGSFTVLHSFSSTDGAYPLSPLVLGANGNLYGTTTEGGTYGAGTAFMITPGGTFTSLHSFNPTADGNSPEGALVQAANGYFYGTAAFGGATCNGAINNNGTVFLIGPWGRTFQKLYDFAANCHYGSNPRTGLVLDADGNLYGAASGANPSISSGENATLFEITQEGRLTTLYTFASSTYAGPNLMQATNGTFYGTATLIAPGYVPNKTIFSLSTSLGPFITTVPSRRPIGAKVLILGQGLTGATEVNFNGVLAQFTVSSDTEIITSVPAGAKTGYVDVTTPKGKLRSKVVFVVG